MKQRIFKGIYIAAVLIIIIIALVLVESEEFDRIAPLEGDGEYLIHETPLIPRESPGLMIAEDGRLFLFYIESELVNVYDTSGHYLYGLQFPDTDNDISDMCYRDGLLYVDARLSGIYVFQDTQLLRFELQHYQNKGHDELEAVFPEEEDHQDGEYVYSYLESANQILRSRGEETEIVVQFPQRKYSPIAFAYVGIVMLIAGNVLWGNIPQGFRKSRDRSGI